MSKTILSVFVLGFFLGSPTWSCGYGALNSESDTFNSRLSSRMPVSQDMIKDSLHFVHKLESIEDNYKQPAQFEKLYATVSTATDLYYSEFFRNCHELYSATDSLKTKVSIHLLLERVSERYFRSIELNNQRRRLLEEASAEPREPISWADADRILSTFFPETVK